MSITLHKHAQALRNTAANQREQRHAIPRRTPWAHAQLRGK
jgi:hypothetical protein